MGRLVKGFEGLSQRVSRAAGSFWAAMMAVLIVLGWAAGGLVVGFSEAYQMPINTMTTIITFVMVFILQNTTNRNERAIQLKLDNIIHSIESANNALIGVEEKSAQEIEQLRVDETEI